LEKGLAAQKAIFGDRIAAMYKERSHRMERKVEGSSAGARAGDIL
jgi:hypothetical protein